VLRPGFATAVPLQGADRMARVLDYAALDCSGGTAGPPWCGTGGCAISLWVAGPDGERRVHAGQALEWRLSPGPPATLLLRVHGSYCGGAGPDPCAAAVTLRDGAVRIQPP
jgi:hypothetical protein